MDGCVCNIYVIFTACIDYCIQPYRFTAPTNAKGVYGNIAQYIECVCILYCMGYYILFMDALNEGNIFYTSHKDFVY